MIVIGEACQDDNIREMAAASKIATRDNEAGAFDTGLDALVAEDDDGMRRWNQNLGDEQIASSRHWHGC